MAWEWSHTDEAYANAYEHVQRLPKETLLTILEEWRYSRIEKLAPYTLARGDWRLPSHVYDLTQDVLADEVWRRMEAYRTCTNGGHEAYCCPDGCHTVPFDPVSEEEDH